MAIIMTNPITIGNRTYNMYAVQMAISPMFNVVNGVDGHTEVGSTLVLRLIPYRKIVAADESVSFEECPDASYVKSVVEPNIFEAIKSGNIQLGQSTQTVMDAIQNYVTTKGL